MLKTNSRKVNFYELNVLTTSREIASPPQTSILDFIDAVSNCLTKNHEILFGKNPAEVTDFKWDKSNSRLILLLNKPDPELSDVAYKDITTKSRRSGNKKPTEAIELSSHVVIQLDKTNPSAPAQVAMTMEAGIYIAHIVNLLNGLYRDNKKTSAAILNIIHRSHPTGAKDSGGKPITYASRHKISYAAHPNTELKEILTTGFLNGIELIETSHQNFDSNTPYEITRHSLKVNTGHVKLNPAGIRKIIQTGTTKHQIHADKVKIEYEDSNGNPGSRSLNVNQLDEAFTRTAVIDLEAAHAQQQTMLSSEIVEKLISLG